MASVATVMYRQLLRLGRSLDRDPIAKALLIAQPALLFDRRSRALVRLPALSGPSGHWASLLEAFNGGEFYKPESSAREAVRRARYNDGPASSTADPIDFGLMALRSLGLAVAGGESLSKLAFEGERPGIVSRVASLRAANVVRPGSLLLTHPVSCLKQPTLHHSVILIVSAEVPHCTRGT